MTQTFTPTRNLAVVGLLAGVVLGTYAKTNARGMSKQMQDALADSRAKAGFARATLRGGMREALTELQS